MPIKRVICPERIRQTPAHVSWIDHRLVRERYIERCDACAAALYLFLVTVADAQCLSYFADATLARRLSMAPARMEMARSDLIRVGLIAWQRPLTPAPPPPPPAPAPAPPPATSTAAAPPPPPTTPAGPRQVTYSVTGTKAPGDIISVTYVDASGRRRTQHNVYIPWSMTVTPISQSDVGSVEASSLFRVSRLNCSITTSDGTVLSSNTNDSPQTSC